MLCFKKWSIHYALPMAPTINSCTCLPDVCALDCIALVCHHDALKKTARRSSSSSTVVPALSLPTFNALLSYHQRASMTMVEQQLLHFLIRRRCHYHHSLWNDDVRPSHCQVLRSEATSRRASHHQRLGATIGGNQLTRRGDFYSSSNFFRTNSWRCIALPVPSRCCEQWRWLVRAAGGAGRV